MNPVQAGNKMATTSKNTTDTQRRKGNSELHHGEEHSISLSTAPLPATVTVIGEANLLLVAQPEQASFWGEALPV